MAPIQNHDTYCGAMQGSLAQKLFFVEHLPKLDYLLDYGCADGHLLRALYRNNPWGNPVLVGFDQDEQMIERAEAAALVGGGPLFVSNEAHALSNLTLASKKGALTSAVLLSSVLHEMYSQSADWKMTGFWKRLAATSVEYIIIRDMFWDEREAKPRRQFAPAIERNYPKEAADFDLMLSCGQSIDQAKYATEFLLKYPYQENWNRELLEDYFSIPVSLPARIQDAGYELVMWKPHCVPFIQERIKRDVGVELSYPTHVHGIFKRRIV
ncbi:class I SAM-dependent methyltransferase [Hymenobacter algoricola]|uniref:Methyltransferase domain-containing protein n=1 Tax=Hymenobacter algoricola TaxID=486267 RepID=A0ABP7NTT2_9BACT